MKVLLVNDVPLGRPGSGGAEAYLLQLREVLLNAGHRVVVLTRQHPGEPETCTDGSYLIPDFDCPPLRKRAFRGYRNQSRALRRVREIVERENPEVIHVNNLLDPRALRLLRTMRPVVKSIHDCRPFCAKPYPAVASRLIGDSATFCDITMSLRCWRRCYARAGVTLRERMEAWTYFPRNLLALREVLACDRLIVYSAYLQELALRCVPDPRRVELVCHFSDAEDHAPEAAPASGRPPVFLFVGRLSKEKGIAELLAAVARLGDVDFRLVIAGDGPLRAQGERDAQAAGLSERISWTGFLRRPQLFRQYDAADVLVFPSIGSEGCPLTGIEAMYAGKPVIAFDTGGVREWCVDGVTGILLARGDVAGLADAVKKLAQDPHWRETLGRSARQYVSHKFRKEDHVRRLVSIYSQLAACDRVRAVT